MERSHVKSPQVGGGFANSSSESGDESRTATNLPAESHALLTTGTSSGQGGPPTVTNESDVDFNPSATAQPMSDAYLGARFAEQCVDSVRYCPNVKRWLAWDGKRWAWAEEETTIVSKAIAVARTIYCEWFGKGGDERRWAMKISDLKNLRSMVKVAKTYQMMHVDLASLDAHPRWFNCQDVTIDLETGNTWKHRKSDYITAICPHAYKPDATSVLWDNTIAEIFQNRPEAAAYAQETLGYSISADQSESAFFIWQGDGGDGKSTILEAVFTHLGEDYAADCPRNTLMRSSLERHPMDVHTLTGKRFVKCEESEAQSELSESLIKMLTGGGTFSSRGAYEGFSTNRITFHVFFATNPEPIIKGDDEGIRRRIQYLKFYRQFHNSECLDVSIRERVKSPEMGEAVIRWLVDGARRAFSRNRPVVMPEEVKKSTSIYLAGSDSIEEFFTTHCIDDPDAESTNPQLQRRFQEWFRTTGRRNTPKKSDISRYLRSKYREGNNGNITFHGIRLRTDEEMEA
jgi:putative DNA primase/helicase